MFENNKTWPFEEARRIYEKIGGKVPEKGYVLFETGMFGEFMEVSITNLGPTTIMLER